MQKRQKGFYRFKTPEEVKVHKVDFYLRNHYEVDEIASELHITITEVQTIIETKLHPEWLFMF